MIPDEEFDELSAVLVSSDGQVRFTLTEWFSPSTVALYSGYNEEVQERIELAGRRTSIIVGNIHLDTERDLQPLFDSLSAFSTLKTGNATWQSYENGVSIKLEWRNTLELLVDIAVASGYPPSDYEHCQCVFGASLPDLDRFLHDLDAIIYRRNSSRIVT